MSFLDICLPFTKHWEGCKLTAYWDEKGKVWTVGYGATGPHIVEGTVWTQDQADQDLKARLSIIGDEIDGAIIMSLNDNEKAALVDFTYNEGIGNFLRSSVRSELNAGNPKVAMVCLCWYNKSSGSYVQGLENRREDEVRLFNGQETVAK